MGHSWLAEEHWRAYSLNVNTTEAFVKIPVQVLASIDTMDELEDWLLANDPVMLEELRGARSDDRNGRFKPFKPRFS